MSTYKTLLINFMQEKNVIVRKHSGLLIATAPDLKEIRDDWSEEQCKVVMLGINYSYDSGLCPWCILHDSCAFCAYGERNGWCMGIGRRTRYHRIRSRLGTHMSISDLPGMRNLVVKYREIVRRELNNEIQNHTD